MKKIILTVLAVSVLLSGCGSKKPGTAGTDAATEVSVTTQKSEIKDFSVYSTYSGTVNPDSEISVTPKLGGKVVSDNTEIGKFVTAGTVLFTLESTDQSLQVSQAQAAYNSALANYERTIGGSAAQSILQLEQSLNAAENELNDARTNLSRAQEAFDSKITINQAKNAVDQAQIAYDNALELLNSNAAVTAAQTNYDSAKSTYERTAELYSSGAVSKSSFESAENAYKAAEAQLHSAKLSAQQNVQSAKIALDNAQQQYKNAEINLTASLDAAKTRYSNAEANYNAAKENLELTQNVVNPENAKNAKAQVASAKASLDIAKQALENTVITAPFSGTISAENISVGEMAAAGSSYVKLVNLDAVTIEINISENMVSSVTSGTPATISVASAGISEITGTVAAISPVAYNGMFTAKIHVANSDGMLKGGMAADVGLATGIAENAVVIPTEAIIKSDDESYVYINNNGKPEKITVTTGIGDDEFIQITSGLTGGEDVVVKGKDFITDNCILSVNN